MIMIVLVSQSNNAMKFANTTGKRTHQEFANVAQPLHATA